MTSPVSFDDVLLKLKEEEAFHMDTLFELIRQRSISAQNIGVEACADLLQSMMEDAGIDTQQLATEGFPVVYGEVIHPDNDLTILFYGHYDVQPPEPLELWDTDPFEPTIRNGKIYGRGTGDNKGQLIAHVLAVKALLDLHGRLPVNVKFLFEGEEEKGSIHLAPFAQAHQELLKADIAYTADGPMEGKDQPSVTLGNRGLLYIELNAQGAVRDNHSGNKGNIAPNPAMALINLIRTMVDESGNVLIEGFYDDILVPTDEEIEHIRSLPFDPVATAAVIGVDAIDLSAEAYYRKLSLSPTFNIAGFGSGYTGEGTKTIIPSQATVKIDMRLAADQHPEKIFQAILEHVERFESDCTIAVDYLGGVKPSRTPLHLDIVQKVIESVQLSHNKMPVVLPALGGTGPMYIFTDILGIPSLTIPYANVDEDNHAPNENMGVSEYLAGIKTTCAAILHLGEQI
ncbi:M20/M25/M40 family metallo-hydrolase [Marinilactibacillus kalidii]|uniref:M20/M25/M40 family metallo-hydrolase n=1 Tax=Marinilactibacillus kalidii TaxID=2820274 RepID=UPI001ABDCEB1|nr:M20/M25/M40 family metallo-hydrolase [Marinilactibacillus kalidii]